MAKCKYCEVDNLRWENIKGKWILHDDEGERHYCEQEMDPPTINKKHEIGDVVLRNGANCNGTIHKNYYAVYSIDSDNRHIKTWETQSLGGVSKTKMSIVRKYNDIRTGDIVWRSGGSTTGSNGSVVKNDLYLVHDTGGIDSPNRKMISLFKTKGGAMETPCWDVINFKIAIPVEAVNQGQKMPTLDIQNSDGTQEPLDAEPAIENISNKKRDITDHEYEIRDIGFEAKSATGKKSVLRGFQWTCDDCGSSWPTEEGVVRCCMAKVVLYTAMPDSYYWSTSKKEPVLIAKMMNVHLKNAINKLERELDSNDYFHLLPALVAEAERRQLNWQDDDVIEDDEADDVKEILGL